LERHETRSGKTHLMVCTSNPQAKAFESRVCFLEALEHFEHLYSLSHGEKGFMSFRPRWMEEQRPGGPPPKESRTAVQKEIHLESRYNGALAFFGPNDSFDGRYCLLRDYDGASRRMPAWVACEPQVCGVSEGLATPK
jgi:hypothetical protein